MEILMTISLFFFAGASSVPRRWYPWEVWIKLKDHSKRGWDLDSMEQVINNHLITIIVSLECVQMCIRLCINCGK
jgi:hypothetical protein